MSHEDLSLIEVLRDPLIRQVMRADRVSLQDMAGLLADASQRLKNAKRRDAFSERENRLLGSRLLSRTAH